MQTKSKAPPKHWAARLRRHFARNTVNAEELISPTAIAKERWRIRPSPVVCPSIGTL
jgi:hypothetical protein